MIDAHRIVYASSVQHAARAERRQETVMSQPEHAHAAQPSRDAIAKRAYELYLQRGSVSGYELEDWLSAEAELTAAAVTSARALGKGAPERGPRDG
jgi:hypothetical protein